MKHLLPAVLLLCLLGSCRQDQRQIVDGAFVDSLIQKYTIPAFAKQNREEMHFWQNRIDPAVPGYLNESRYAAGLAMDFRLLGDIDSLKRSDSILLKVSRDYNHKEASVLLALASHSITEHRFREADSILLKARWLGLKQYESLSSSFDVDFELGRYSEARIGLNALRSANDFGYYFRASKVDHLNGSIDSAISDMLKSAELTGTSDYLKGVALSGAADLYIHAGDCRSANGKYMECIRTYGADLHSIIGLGWIALVHDHNDAQARKIFRFVSSKTQLPDPLFKLSEITGNDAEQLSAARDFEKKATDARYGGMYNKYLIQLYTGILRNPARAESIAKDELNNRSTPQTYAWYAWALFSNNKKDEAYRIFESHVSGQPLEALELYYMGKLMRGLNKGYNAQEFFKAAYATRYDLGPAIEEDLTKELGN